MTLDIKRIWPQWLAGIATTFLVIEAGMIAAWSSPYVAKLTAPDAPNRLTLEQASWIASLANFSRLFGAIGGAIGCQLIGSKKTNLLALIPGAICWILEIVGTSVMWLYAARLSGGICLGMAFSCFPLYLGEISDAKTRGALVTMAVMGAPIGNTAVSLIGAAYSIVESSCAFLVVCIILILCFLWLPESPHHLIKNSKKDSARASIAWYHRGCDIDAEYTAIESLISSNRTPTFRETIREFRRPEIKRASFVIIALYMFMQISGLNSMIFYMATILRHAEITVIDPYTCATVVMGFGIVSALISISLMDRLGRRPLLVFSSLLLVASLVGLEVYFILLVQNGAVSESLQWLPIIALITAVIALFLGLLPVPSTVLSELFPPNLKCIASCGSGIASGVFGFLSTKTYQPLVSLMGEQYVYWIYIAIALMAIPVALIYMPETKGKSLQQIQDDLRKGR